MEYLTYFVWANCFVGTSKMSLVLTPFSATIWTVNALHKEAGITQSTLVAAPGCNISPAPKDKFMWPLINRAVIANLHVSPFLILPTHRSV
jgi:hypothetical protein